MKPYFSDKVLLLASEEEIILLRTAVSNMVWRVKDEETRKELQKLDEDLMKIMDYLPF